MNELIKTKMRILQLIEDAVAQFAGTGKTMPEIEDFVAEYLAANGVIVKDQQPVWQQAMLRNFMRGSEQ